MSKLAQKAFEFGENLSSSFAMMGSGLIDIVKKGGDMAGGVIDMLLEKAEKFATSWLDNVLNNGVNAALQMFGLGAGQMAGGMWNIPSGHVPGGFYPGFASGTNSAPGGMAWVGERGPELVNLPRGSQVYEHNRSMGMAANQNRPISVQTNIINNAGVEVIEDSVDDGQGGVRQEITLNRAVAQQIAKPGAANSAVRGVGRLVRR